MGREARVYNRTRHALFFFNGNPRLGRGGGARAAARARRAPARAHILYGATVRYRKKYKGDYNNRRQAAAALRRDAALSPSTEPREGIIGHSRGSWTRALHVPTGVPTALAATAACATSSPR